MFTLWTQIWKHHGLWVNSVDDLLLQMDHEAKTASYKLTFYVNTFEQIYAYIQFNQIMTTYCYGTTNALYHSCRILYTVYSPSPQLIGSAPGIRAGAFTTRRHPRSVLLSRRCLVPARLLLQIPPHRVYRLRV